MVKHYSYEGERPKRGSLGIKVPVVYVHDINKLRSGQPKLSTAGVNSDVMVYDSEGKLKYKQAPSYLAADRKGHPMTIGGQILERYR